MAGTGKETCSFKVQDVKGFMMDVPLVVNWSLKKDTESTLPFSYHHPALRFLRLYSISIVSVQSEKETPPDFPNREGFNIGN